MKVTVHAHGELRRFLGGRGTLQAEVPNGATVREVLDHLGVPDAEVWFASVDGEPVAGEHRLRPGDELTVFSPVEGGAT